MPLTSKQRRQLKSRGQTMPDDCHLGKAGMDDAFIKRAGELLARKELVKLRFNDRDIQGEMRRELADEVCAALEAECVGVVGRTVLIYKANAELSPEAKIVL